MRCESLRDELFGRLSDDLLPEELGREWDTLGVDGLEYEGFGADGREYDGLGVDGLEYEGFGADGREYDGLGVDGLEYEGFGVDGREYDGFGVDGRTALCRFRSEFSSRARFCVLVAEGFTVEGLSVDGRLVEGFTVDGLTVEGRTEVPFRVVDAVPVRSRKLIGCRLSLDGVTAGRTVLLLRARRLPALRFVAVATLAGLLEFG